MRIIFFIRFSTQILIRSLYDVVKTNAHHQCGYEVISLYKEPLEEVNGLLMTLLITRGLEVELTIRRP